MIVKIIIHDTSYLICQFFLSSLYKHKDCRTTYWKKNEKNESYYSKIKFQQKSFSNTVKKSAGE